MTDEPGIYFIPALIDDWKASGNCSRVPDGEAFAHRAVDEDLAACGTI